MEDFNFVINHFNEEKACTFENYPMREWSANIFYLYNRRKYIYDDCFITDNAFNTLLQNGLIVQKKDKYHQGEKAKRYEFVGWDEFSKKKKKIKIKKISNISIPPNVRFNVFKKCNYSCKFCGRNVNDGVKLEVDHIIPKSKGGSNHIDNLQILCRECNIGKGNKYE